MKIKMLKSINGTVNGEKMGPYLLGQEYDLDSERAVLFIGSAMAETVVDAPVIIEEPTTEEPVITVQQIDQVEPDYFTMRGRKLTK